MNPRDPFLADDAPGPEEPALDAIVALVSRTSGIDFGAYKRSMLGRRVGHRALLSGAGSLEAYLKLVETDAAEQERLRSALLIQTTGAFRGARTFDLLRGSALPELVRRRAAEGAYALRAWVSACATGDEAWSLAMCLVEAGERFAPGLRVEVLASDVDRVALARASTGLLPTESVADVPEELARRFLVADGGAGRVSPELAGLVRFVRHDALDARPTPREAVLASFDVVSCRNLLIYLGPEAQERVVRALVTACEPDGLVLLDESESPPPACAGALVRLDARAGVWARR